MAGLNGFRPARGGMSAGSFCISAGSVAVRSRSPAAAERGSPDLDPGPTDRRDRLAHRPVIPSGKLGTGRATIRKGEHYSIREGQDWPRLLRCP
jgi:hypothetical protein